jgi:hypothetical protein
MQSAFAQDLVADIGRGREAEGDSVIALSDAQLKVVMAAASHVPHEKRGQFLERVAAMLAHRGRGHFDDAAVADAVARALTGLAHTAAGHSAWFEHLNRALRETPYGRP